MTILVAQPQGVDPNTAQILKFNWVNFKFFLKSTQKTCELFLLQVCSYNLIKYECCYT